MKGSAPFTTGACPYTERVRWKPFRITELWAKIAYVLVGWFLVPISLGTVMTRLGVQDLVVIVVHLALSFLVVWLGTRAFRAQGEPVEPPRVGWRATGRPRAGFVLGSLFLWASIIFLVSPLAGDDPTLRWSAVSTVPISLFYLHSSIRLVRGDAPVPPKPRRDDDLQLIDRKRRF